MFDLRRRQIISLLSGVGVTWSFAVHAQLTERKRRIGVLWQFAADDPATGPLLSAFRQALEQLGWSENRDVVIDYRFAGGISDRYLPLAQELIASRPDVIWATGTPITATLHRETLAIPIVFTSVSDPIGAGFVTSLARPGGNITGVLLYEAGIIGKWLATLRLPLHAGNNERALSLGSPRAPRGSRAARSP
jgi:putative tryptophan/tyrosine transport system substrate-binding protein